VVGGRPPCKRDALPAELTAPKPNNALFIATNFREQTNKN